MTAGILFEPDMIKAIVEGRKTVTRRLSGLDEVNKEPGIWDSPVTTSSREGWLFSYPSHTGGIVVKPRYHVGQVVYVKEAWATEAQYNSRSPSNIPEIASIWYASDGVGEWPLNLPIGKLRSPMFLRECHARYFIRILEVRPERLQEITEEDAIAEGMKRHLVPVTDGWLTPVEQFTRIWNRINPKHHWASNCWVWRYRFELTGREK